MLANRFSQWHGQPSAIIVDEFQNYLMSDTVPTLLSEMRKYRLAVTIAHQHRGQSDDATADAVFGNAGIESSLAEITPQYIAAVERLTQHVQVVQDILDEIREEPSYAVWNQVPIRLDRLPSSRIASKISFRSTTGLISAV